MSIGTQPRSHGALVRSCHSFDLPRMCPISGNPQPGSVLELWYSADDCYLEIESLGAYIDSFIGGRQIGRVFVRDMEQTIQAIASACASAIGVRVVCIARLRIADDPEERARVRELRVIVRAEKECTQ
jgi:NADPH-dependent 7-cyano-7-deazaguanine reductase QueF